MRKPETIVVLGMVLIGAAILGFAVFRASTASFTHDESYTYMYYPHQPVLDILRHKEAFTNNHLLNTLGMKYSEMLFGTSELSLRLPNLLLLVVYLWYGARLFAHCDKVIALSVFVLLCTNSVLIELFTLARGYGLSFGFMLMAVFHLMRAVRDGGWRHLVLYHVAAILACLSNFTMLDLYAAGLVTYYLAMGIERRSLRQERRAFRNSALLNATMLLVAAGVLWSPVQNTWSNNVLDFGGKSGLYEDTVHALVSRWFAFCSISPLLLSMAQVLFITPVLFSVVIIIRRVALKAPNLLAEGIGLFVSTSLLVLICIGTMLQHHLLGTNYLQDRFAMFLVPLMVINLGYLLLYLATTLNRPLLRAGVLSLALLSAYGFVHSSGPYRSFEWGYDMRTKEAMRALVADHEAHGNAAGPVRIGNNWLFEPTINFYRDIWHLDWLSRAHRKGISDQDDYIYILQDDAGTIDAADHVQVATFDRSGTVLFRRMNK